MQKRSTVWVCVTCMALAFQKMNQKLLNGYVKRQNKDMQERNIIWALIMIMAFLEINQKQLNCGVKRRSKGMLKRSIILPRLT